MNGYKDYPQWPLPPGAKVCLSDHESSWPFPQKNRENHKNRSTSTEDRIINIVADKLGVERSKIRKDSRLDYDLSADSFDQIEIITRIEKEYDYSFTHFIFLSK